MSAGRIIVRWIIRDKITGAVLPEPGDDRRLGASRVSLIPLGDKRANEVRFFRRESDARRALREWLRGVASYDGEDVLPVAGRDPKRMEVAPCHISLPGAPSPGAGPKETFHVDAS